MHNREIPVVFTNEGMQIMGVLHRPDTGEKPPAVVFYHGCTGSKTEAHWLFVKLARYLADRGIMALRFDFRHSGESDGRFEDMTLSGEISDGVRAVEYIIGECGADPDRTGLLGLSMGGAVAAIVSGRLRSRVRSCALLNPVAHPFEDLSSIALARELNTVSFPVEFNSFLFGKPFFDELANIHPLDEISRASCPALVINGPADRTVHPSRSREYFDILRGRDGIPSEFHVIKGADHTFASAAWERAVMERVGEWFGRTL
jgi:uncharacterized protein